MKTLKWISDVEVSVISIIKFIGDFDIKVDTPKCIKIIKQRILGYSVMAFFNSFEKNSFSKSSPNPGVSIK